MEATQHSTLFPSHFSLKFTKFNYLIQVGVGQAKVSPHSRSVDPAEENDADDEGEIWYNPIPEDDEPEMSHRPSVRLVVPPRAEPQRRPSRGGEVGHSGKSLECNGGAGPEALTESLGGGSGDGSQGNAVHSTEALHLHRQMLACKPQEEGGPSTSRATGIEQKKKKKTDTHTSHSYLPFLPAFCRLLYSSFSLTFLWADAQGPIIVSQLDSLGRFLRLYTP